VGTREALQPVGIGVEVEVLVSSSSIGAALGVPKISETAKPKRSDSGMG